MIRLSAITFIALAVVTASFGQGFLARDSLGAANARAQQLRSDNQLVAIVSASSFVPTTGTATMWQYVYRSPTRTTFTFVIAGYPGGMLVDTNGSTTGAPTTLATMPANFANSNVAIAAAEANGGLAYRQANTSASVQLYAGRLGYYAPDTTRFIWYARYTSTNAAPREFYMDLVTGSIIATNNANESRFTPLPTGIVLNQNYPNPFNPTTSISFSLPAATNIRLTVTDMTGREIAMLASGRYSTGNHSVSFDGKTLASGSYFYKLNADGKVHVKQMELVK